MIPLTIPDPHKNERIPIGCSLFEIKNSLNYHMFESRTKASKTTTEKHIFLVCRLLAVPCIICKLSCVLLESVVFFYVILP